MILCSNPQAQYQAHKAEIDTAILRVLDKGWYILGEETKMFEAEFAAYIGVAHGIGVGSGTEALHIALKACGIGFGDEVITVSHTAVATVAAIELAGATPVLVDIEPDYFTLDPDKLEAAISPRTKAIIVVHLYGQPANLASILEIARRHGVRLVEDCAQAHGAIYGGQRVGAWGDIACFSFYPTKNLGALGDGGMIVTNDAVLAERSYSLREYGWVERYVSHTPGLNSRLDEVQAAVLRVKLRTLDTDNAMRARLAQGYDRAFMDMQLNIPKCRLDASHVFHLYVIRCYERDELKSWLKARGVGALIHYPVPVHLQPAYKGRALAAVDGLVITEDVCKKILSLPMYPQLTNEQVTNVCNRLKA
jgi:dTDP-4-amino-4,6-dideoxygalactose transaminase